MSKIADESSEASYWILAAREYKGEAPDELVARLVGKNRVWGLKKGTPGRKSIKAGDWLCFYASEKGVVAHARVTEGPSKTGQGKGELPKGYSDFVIQLDQVELYIQEPVPIDEETRERMEVFSTYSDPKHRWGWLLIRPNMLSRHDFRLVTREESPSS